MGVYGLETYLTKHCKFGSGIVSIPELIERTYTGVQKPVIVVDGCCWVYKLLQSHHLAWIGGGQFKQMCDIIKQFIDKFKRIGVRLVFFFDGHTECWKRKLWIMRRNREIKSVYSMLNALYIGGRASDRPISGGKMVLPSGMWNICYYTIENICGCKIYQSLSECDGEIAEYAKCHKAFAIMSQDSDFAILDSGGAHFLSLYVNLATMTTRRYHRQALADHLGIDIGQLPLLATLMGNDAISTEDLKEFHKVITDQASDSPEFKDVAPKLGEYIRTLPPCEMITLLELEQVSNRVFGNPDRSTYIWNSIHSYIPSKINECGKNLDKKWAEILYIAKQNHVEKKYPSMIFSVMDKLLFEGNSIIEDFRKDDLPCLAQVSLPLRKKLYGILLQEKPLLPGQKEHSVEEWGTLGPENLNQASCVTVELSEHTHPGLKALWTCSWRQSSVRWELFVHSVVPHLDVQQVQYLPPHLVIPTLILVFLFKYLHMFEIDTMLATAASLSLYNSGRLKSLPSYPINPRGVRLASLVMAISDILHGLLAACGNPLTFREASPVHFFDGKLFQVKYIAAERGDNHIQLCNYDDNVLQHFQKARNVVLGVKDTTSNSQSNKGRRAGCNYK